MIQNTSISRYLPGGDEGIIQRDVYIMFTSALALYIVSKIWNQPKCPLTNDWI